MSRDNYKAGSDNEIMILTAINKHQFKDLDEKWKAHIKKMFKNIKDEDTIYAYFYPDKHAKPDIVVRVGHKKVMLSIKSGHAPVVHQEETKTFLYFLHENGVPDRIISILYFYIKGKTKNVSNNGKPFTREELIERYGNYFKEANEYFITHKEISRQIIYRSIFQGIRNSDSIDYLYYGNSARGFLLSMNDVMKEILSDKNMESNVPHFYALTIQAMTRNENSSKHIYMKILWPVLCVKFYDEEFNQVHIN